MHLAIRADGGPEIGFGHLVRTGAIASEAHSRGHDVTYVTTTPDAVQQAVPIAAHIATLDSRDDSASFAACLETNRPDIVLADAYPIDTEYQRTVRQSTSLAVISDHTQHEICADILINGNIYANALMYECVGVPPIMLLGPDYVPLRSRIRELSMESPPWRDTPERALVTMGGSDITGHTPAVLRAFDGLDIRVAAIVGPGVSSSLEHEIRTTAAEISSEVTVTRNPDTLPELMLDADFAVSTSSTTTYELLALGTPIISIPVVDNQQEVADALADRDAAVVLSRNAGAQEIRSAINAYLEKPELRRAHRNRGRDIVDGKGANRIVDEITAFDKDPEQ